MNLVVFLPTILEQAKIENQLKVKIGYVLGKLVFLLKSIMNGIVAMVRFIISSLFQPHPCDERLQEIRNKYWLHLSRGI